MPFERWPYPIFTYYKYHVNPIMLWLLQFYLISGYSIAWFHECDGDVFHASTDILAKERQNTASRSKIESRRMSMKARRDILWRVKKDERSGINEAKRSARNAELIHYCSCIAVRHGDHGSASRCEAANSKYRISPTHHLSYRVPRDKG